MLLVLQETDDNEPQLEDAIDPTQTVVQSSDPLPAERDVPVNVHAVLILCQIK